MNPREILFRCSSLGNIMTDGKKTELTELQKKKFNELSLKKFKSCLTDKQEDELKKLMNKQDSKPELSDGCKTHLIDVYVSNKYGRREEVSGKMLDKGNEREEDSITLLSRVSKIMFRKNDIKLSNEFIRGECDIYLGEKISAATEVFDTKTSWSAHTFFRASKKRLESGYYYQGMGYMALTGAKKHSVCYCLVNGTYQAIIDEQRRLAFKMNLIDPDINPEYIEKCKQIEINHIFDISSFMDENPHYQLYNDRNSWSWDIPMEERVHIISFDRNERIIDKIYSRVEECREYLANNFNW